ncbi:hypothetical protein [Phaeobacter inhibens]|uniref:hypothetical protein n=1 Tax=Phaeobacter inhibens TaxID=221822 RepID=UPI001E47DA92|nr:hypothetical protein [Phaeobacter inhibens]WHP69920.1 hypothetical protein QMZ01_07030 [Phaeobacter inhibens]
MDTLPISRVTFHLGRAVTFSETGGGERIAHGRGARLWGGKVVLDKDTHANWAAIEARMALLEEPGASFLLRDPRMTGPIADPVKHVLGAAEPEIGAVSDDLRSMDISRLPAGYIVSTGDLLGFQYGANPKRFACHRVVVGSIADSVGRANAIEVTPFLRPGASVGTPITLGTPVLKATLNEAEYGASRATISQGGSFDWVQTLR